MGVETIVFLRYERSDLPLVDPAVKLVGRAGFEPTSRSNLELRGYKARILPLNYLPIVCQQAFNT